MGEYVYRYEINLAEMADEYAKRLQERVDGMALDKAADALERFGYVKVIRCRDCRHFAGRDGLCMRLFNAMAVEPHGFCAWGLRRNDTENGMEVQ